MPTDVEIARSVSLRPIVEIAESIALSPADLHPYGHHIAKVDLGVLDRPRAREGVSRLVLVSAINPTPAGEGKTTTSIGLAQGLARIGESVCLALREPSLGPCMGVKGGATGGGYSQVAPVDRINLHFTGDFHAITSAHNLIAAALDNHIHFKGTPQIDTTRVVWPRVLDMNDRALRRITVGLQGNGVPREGGFDITAASEVMAMLCLARDPDDLRARIDRTLVAYDLQGAPVYARELGVTGAVMALLRDALMPNLVQTLEGVPALVHGGPFANIAHGCNSVLATRMAQHLADWTITEAGFGFDLGAEKFLDIKCIEAGLEPAGIVIVATIRALKLHGGVPLKELGQENADATAAGLCNLEKHIETAQAFGYTPVVALNRFGTDSDAEIERVRARCQELGVPFAVSDHHARGGEGAEALARVVAEHMTTPRAPKPTYERSWPVVRKVKALARTVYGAADVEFTRSAYRDLAGIKKLGYLDLPICMAKTQNSLSDDAAKRGRPEDFTITVRNVRLNTGAGFLVVLTGDIMRMPGLPKRPRACDIDLVDGVIIGTE